VTIGSLADGPTNKTLSKHRSLSLRNYSIVMSSETPFQISVPDDALALLRRKLGEAHFPDELSDAGWDYGSPLSDVKRLVDKWKDSYDWRTHERELNKLPMFTRDIEVEGFGVLNIHYVHQKSKVESAIPLLFVHGCT
jgi:Epoxide hydrolase N terminus